MSEPATLDPLTNAYTRATFSDYLHANLQQAQQAGTSCSLLVFDLDHFKSINDAFGHAQGDEALRGVGRLVHNLTRTTDLFFRYGGDEFVLILPNTAKAEAVGLAQRLLETIRSKPLGQTITLTLTLSIGVATFPEDAVDDHALFEKADARNYEAKRRGRARVIYEDASATADLPFASLARLIERDDVLETVQDFLEGLAQPQHGVLSVVGAAGAGRSRLLAEVEKRARLQGFQVLTLHGSARLKAKPYGVLESLIPQNALAPALPGNLEIFSGFLQQQLASAGHSRMLLCVDDLPHLDWGTLDLLRQLLATSEIPCLGLVYVSDPDNARLAAPFGAALSERVTLSPLSSTGLRLWLRVLLQWEPPDDFINWLHKQTRGLPQQVEQVLRQMLKQGTLLKQEPGWRLAENYAALEGAGLPQVQRRSNPNNLPVALTSFIGRENELAEVRRLLATTHLLTVVGPGGMGKTRLGLQVAREVLTGFKDGVWLIELAPLTDPTLTLYTVASVLGVREEQNRPLIETLGTWLSNKEALFIFDNCEHLLDACVQFADSILRVSPEVRILACSREAFDIAGELVYRIPALAAPQPSPDLGLAQLMPYGSARLFIERATFADSTFGVTPANAPLIAQICRQLDGIPLAIELAAARLKSMDLEEIAARLEDRFNLLTTGNRAALRRQQTLRSLIDWSYDLLSDSERVLLRRLSVFVGGFTLAAAEQTCATSTLAASQVSDLLKRLANKSLINFDDQSSPPRYAMLETIKQYAHEKLQEAGEEELLHTQHLACFLELAEQTEPIIISPQRSAWVRQLETEHDNLRAALEWACQQNAVTACWLAGTLGWFWYLGDHLNEGRNWCKRVLALANPAPPGKDLAKALNTAGMLSGNLGYNEESRLWLEQSFTLWQTLAEKHWLAETLFWLSYTLVQLGQDERVCTLYTQHEAVLRNFADPVILGLSLSYWGRALENARTDYAGAKVLHDEGLAFGLAQQDPNILGTCYMNLGYWAARQGDYASGYHYHQESLEWHRRDGARLRIAVSLHNMADMLSLQGQYHDAQPLYVESLALSRALGDQAFIAWTAYRLGYLETHTGAHDSALNYFAESLSLYRGQTEQELITSGLAGCAEWLRVQGLCEPAARLLGYVTAHPQSGQRLFLLSIDSIEYNHTLSALRAQISSPQLDAAWEAGAGLTLEQALALAVESGND